MSGQPTGSQPSPNTDDNAYLKKSKSGGSMTTMLAVVAIVVIIALVAAGGYYAGWFGKSGSGSSTGYQPPCASVAAAGSTFVYPIMAVWTTQYAGLSCSANNGLSSVEVNYQSVGSGTGITDLTDKLVQIGASDAPLSSSQAALMPAPWITMPDSAGAVTIVYNYPGLSAPLNLTGPVLAAIYLGSITNWDDSRITSINPHVTIASQAITVMFRSDGSGTTYAFTSYLSLENATWKSTVGASTAVHFPVGLGQKGSEGVAGGVATTKGAIGYVELNYAKEEGANVQIAAVQNPAGNYISPTVQDTAAAVAAVSSFPAPTGNWSGFSILNQAGASTYPIATFTYLMVYTDLGKVYGTSMTQTEAQAIVSFLWWVTHTGQNQATGLFYVPLPSVVVTSVDEVAIGDIQYNGASLTSH